MKPKLLLAGCLLFALQNSFAVETGLFYCVPMHAAHLIKQANGTISELDIDTTGVVQIIVISENTIEISDNRSDGSKLINIVSNHVDGPVLGRTETRYFYMNDILHFFYGSTDTSNTISYAVDGMCSEFYE